MPLFFFLKLKSNQYLYTKMDGNFNDHNRFRLDINKCFVYETSYFFCLSSKCMCTIKLCWRFNLKVKGLHFV